VVCERDSERVAIKKRLSKLDEARNSDLDEGELQEMYEESKRFGCCGDGVAFGWRTRKGRRRKAMKERSRFARR
jgi:hypothetical protein